MADATGVPGSGPRDPRVGGDWISFEVRMRQRRAATCLQRARAALDHEDFAAARAALDEALALSPESEEAAAFESHLISIEQGRAKRADTRHRSKWTWTAGAAAVLLLGAGVTMTSAVYRFWTSPGLSPGAAREGSGEPAAPITSVSDAGLPERLTIVHDTVYARQASPDLIAEIPQLSVDARRAESEVVDETTPATQSDVEAAAPILRAVNRPDNPSLPAGPVELRREVVTAGLPRETLAGPPLLVIPPDAAAATHRGETEPSEPEPEPERAVESPENRTPPDESIVLEVLSRYERAYSRLDAAAASAVWPSVNRGALARAFDGLASQRVSLGACDVNIDGSAARATCSGTATWEPKIGGGVRTEARRWDFQLKKAGGAWRIERAVAH